jgi:cysteinyl-tRNA synthetase
VPLVRVNASTIAHNGFCHHKAGMTALFFHNSFSRAREPFTPIDPQNVRMYVCGPTVYDLPHLGNLRSNVVFDVVARLLRTLYPRVTYVRNITDVDDKINARAAAEQRSIADLTSITTEDFHADNAAIGNLAPDVEPRATAHIADMIAVIEALLAAGHAYEAEAHVLFSVSSFAGYGALSGHRPQDLIAGARVDVADYKREAGDFVLWKPSVGDEPGWASPWGYGRPGWHIECSAMARRYLGETFDIHGGGSDLLFPHHENERAQSLCASAGSGFAKVWLHNGMLLVNGAKMSKSLGNFFTLRDILARAPAEAIRLLVLRTHYRADLDFTDGGLVDAKHEMDRFYRALQKTRPGEADIPADFLSALCDDLNTPAALTIMRGLADKAIAGDAASASSLRRAGSLLGLLQSEPTAWFQGSAADADIEALVVARAAARHARDFALADSLRAQIEAKGVLLEDTGATTSWRRR